MQMPYSNFYNITIGSVKAEFRDKTFKTFNVDSTLNCKAKHKYLDYD